MKTVFITLFEGVESKNILRTGIVQKVLEHNLDAHVVLFVKNEGRARYYAEEFSESRVSYEVVCPYEQTGIHKLFSSLKFKLLQTETTDLRAQIISEGRGRIGYF